LIADALDEPPEHDDILEDTYAAIEAELDDDIETATDHGEGEEDADGGLAVDDIEGRPDLVISGFAVSNLIIEVETTDVIEKDQSHVIEQVSGFKKNGYTRVLVVPSDAVDTAEELVEEIDGTVHVRTPNSVVEMV